MTACLTQHVPSISGREDFVPVRLTQTAAGAWEATPVFGKSNLITTLTQADGLVRVPLDLGGLYAGTAVTVRLF
ncbi:MAG: hypothetical protein NTZ05_21950 [Chloroflexi bacterium]|nr:hypothetical protein [Chloroflexota bacterium]